MARASSFATRPKPILSAMNLARFAPKTAVLGQAPAGPQQHQAMWEAVTTPNHVVQPARGFCDRLHHRDLYLAFGAPVPRQAESQRQLHSSVYNIFVMTQLARLMIYRYDAFRSQSRRSEINGRQCFGDSAGRVTFNDEDNVALRQYKVGCTTVSPRQGTNIKCSSGGDGVDLGIFCRPILNETPYIATPSTSLDQYTS